MESHGTGLRRVVVLAFCVVGIWSAYIYQGVLQETLSTKQFGPEKKRFEHLAFLNLAQNVVCLIWSFIMIKLWSSGSGGGAPWWSYWSAGISNTIGPAMGIEALKYISYPAQVLAKSSKMIPVMLMGTLVYGIRYTFPEYICTLLVAGGVSAFALLKTSSKTIKKLANPNAPLGYGLCFLNLAFDGFTNATQDSISARFLRPQLLPTPLSYKSQSEEEMARGTKKSSLPILTAGTEVSIFCLPQVLYKMDSRPKSYGIEYPNSNPITR